MGLLATSQIVGGFVGLVLGCLILIVLIELGMGRRG